MLIWMENIAAKLQKERPNGGLQSEIDAGTCDGVDFNLESTCCNNNDFTPCPDPNGCAGKFNVKYTQFLLVRNALIRNN